ADKLEPKDFEPFIKRAADELYGLILDSCEAHLRENVDWNLSQHMAMLERENERMRTELFEVDRALGCLSLGHSTRLAAFKETQERYNQAAAETWRLREELAQQVQS